MKTIIKRILAIMTITAMALSLAACGNAGSGADSSIDKETRHSEGMEAASGSDTVSIDKILVVYFSGSGNTKRAAEFAADELGADLFELVPADPYSEADLDWRDSDSRVNKEHDDVSLQDIELDSTEVSVWSEYDVVLVGYPLWWREAAWPINNFIKNNDFTGKTVIPFCTSTSSGFGDSGAHLAEMAGTGRWIEGKRFSEHEDEDIIKEWVRSLDLE